MLSDEKKKRLDSLTTEEMLYEINLGHRSRFQREKFAYLKTCYELRIANAKIATNKPTKETNTSYNRNIESFSKTLDWHEKPLGKIAIGVIIVILATITLWAINHY